MKLKRLWIFAIVVFVVVFVVVVFVLTLGGRNNIKIQDIEYFRFGYSKGNMINADVEYTLELKDGVYIASIKPDGASIEEKIDFIVDQTFVEELKKLLVFNEVEKWNGFKKTANNILDGNRFYLHISMKDKTYINASGYMRWPKNYSVVKSGVDNIFGRLQK